MTRDKQLKQFKNSSQDDVKRSVQALSADIEMTRKQLNEIDARKADKRDALDSKQKIHSSLDQKIDKSEVQGLFTDFTQDISGKQYSLRKELFDKISCIQHDFSTSINHFVQIDALNKVLDEKADINMLQQVNGQMATTAEVESLRKLLDRIAYEMETKPTFKDLDSHAGNLKDQVTGVEKELLLKASIKDTCQMLDQKVNVGDMNSTLALIQNEVERCVREDDLKKALNEQALVNEALCAENCLGRWIWKTGDLYHKN